MITDALLRLSNAQAVTASAYSTDKIRIGQEDTIRGPGASSTTLVRTRDVGEGREVYVVFTVNTTFLTLTNLTFEIVTSANADLSSHTSIATTGAITLASGGLAAGKQYALRIPPEIAGTGKQYLGARYTVGGSSATAGAVTADLVLDIQDGMKFYDSGFTVA